MFLCLNCRHLEWLQRMEILGEESKNTACVVRANFSTDTFYSLINAAVKGAKIALTLGVTDVRGHSLVKIRLNQK